MVEHLFNAIKIDFYLKDKNVKVNHNSFNSFLEPLDYCKKYKDFYAFIQKGTEITWLHFIDKNVSFETALTGTRSGSKSWYKNNGPRGISTQPCVWYGRSGEASVYDKEIQISRLWKDINKLKKELK